MNYPYLGIHSKYEVCNSALKIEDVISKAKFLGIDTLGIVDFKTLAGTLSFQTACKKAGIKPILGETITVRRKDDYYNIKLYVRNKTGWQNLLRINKEIKVDNDGWIAESKLIELNAGLIVVIPVDSIQYFNKAYFYKFKNSFPEIFFQFDVTSWTSNERDKSYLLNVQTYFKELYPICPPVLIQDTYYLDKEDSHIKSKLNQIGKLTTEYSSSDQYFKNYKEVFLSLVMLFKNDSDISLDLFEESISNVFKIADKCNFEISSTSLHIPSYKMTKEESDKYSNIEEMFDDLILQGLIEIGKDLETEYLDRVKEESSVIKKGGFIDYFLILYDVYRYADENGITRNIGRGSIGGSLVAYCLGLIKIDPIEYGLLFSRFLNEARILKEVEKEMIVLETDNGELVLSPDKTIKILRNMQEMSVLAKKLELNDIII